MKVGMHGGPYEGDYDLDDFPDSNSYHSIGDSGGTVGDMAVYEIVGLTGFFVGFHRELWPDHPRRFERTP